MVARLAAAARKRVRHQSRSIVSVAGREKSQSYLRSVTVERLADKVSGFIDHGYDCAGSGFAGFPHVAAINPKMSFANSLGAATRDNNSGHGTDVITILATGLNTPGRRDDHPNLQGAL